MTATDDITQISPVVRYLDPALDGEAAAILAAAVGSGGADEAAAKIAQARADKDAQLLGLLVDGRLAGAYILRKVGMANEMALLAIEERHRRQGLGRMCAMDALLRSGRRPLTVETDQDGFNFYKAIGFKIVGKRKNADGVTRFRLGWHAPRPNPDGEGVLAC
jgi:ribosomal protein S18 acetylase RimI-like enzyme